MSPRFGPVKLFTIRGITVYLDWFWWILLGTFMYLTRERIHPSLILNAAIYVALFAIVLTHEFGHALACRSVGGKAERIVLWPLGGVAYVQPPPRPGALLWSIAAGPLVNVVLVPVTLFAFLLATHLAGVPVPGLLAAVPVTPAVDFTRLLVLINLSILIFNMLPIYPLDGGQILQSLLWFVVGRPWSLILSGVFGIIGAAGFVLLALADGSLWLAVMAAYMGFSALRGLRFGRLLYRAYASPRHPAPRCPACRENPPIGLFWRCPCGNVFDTFATAGTCPHCGRSFPVTGCPLCGNANPFPQWFAHLPAAPVPPQPAPNPAIVPPPILYERPRPSV